VQGDGRGGGVYPAQEVKYGPQIWPEKHHDNQGGTTQKHYIRVQSTGELHELQAEPIKQVEEQLNEIARKVTEQGYRGVSWELILKAAELKIKIE